MSLQEFSVRLRPVERLRNRVKLFAACCAVAGMVLILQLSVPWPVRGGALLAWLAFSLLELYRYSRSAAAIRWIRLNQSGEVAIVDRKGRRGSSRLLRGTLVTSSVAWLRFGLPNGRKFGELLCKNEVQAAQWHALQLIWQQCRPFVGSAKGS